MDNKIAIYDVRGIQKYIFGTNKVKEIVGASKIVDNLIINEFNNAIEVLIKENKLTKEEVINDWENSNEYLFDKDDSIKIEVLYYGGGNLVILYRNEELLKETSILMSKNIMKKAYGLSLVYAYVDKTDDYNSDWTKLKEELSRIKGVTPPNQPAGINPIVLYDRNTSRPLSKKYKSNGEVKKVSLESYQKLKKYEEVAQEKTPYVKQFDDMRTGEEEGLIAIVHIDGNSMGMNIREIMKDVSTYEEAVKRLRKISSDIHNVFEVKTLEGIINNIEGICKRHGIKYIENKLPFRPLIQAGDDITFVCNARIALDLVKEFINGIKDGYMYDKKYTFSACAGIAIIHSHYPFYRAYEIVEECCQSAKDRAKHEGMIDNKIGNFVDFEYCYTNNISDLETQREANYYSVDRNYLLKRPYGIYDDIDKLTDEQKLFNLDTFTNDLNILSKISRNVVKKLRDEYYDSEAVIKTTLIRQKNKKGELTDFIEPFVTINNRKCANYFDALELFDIFKEVDHE